MFEDYENYYDATWTRDGFSVSCYVVRHGGDEYFIRTADPYDQGEMSLWVPASEVEFYRNHKGYTL